MMNEKGKIIVIIVAVFSVAVCSISIVSAIRSNRRFEENQRIITETERRNRELESKLCDIGNTIQRCDGQIQELERINTDTVASLDRNIRKLEKIEQKLRILENSHDNLRKYCIDNIDNISD